MPASIIEPYNSSIILATSLFDPLVILIIFFKVLSLSPGLILSGLYPQKKSSLYSNPDIFSKTGTQSSSVHPGYTVDS